MPVFFSPSVGPRDLHSFPTRRSSDLYRKWSHAEVILGKVLDGYHHDSKEGPELQLVSMVVDQAPKGDRKSTRLNSSHANISYAVFCLKKKTTHIITKSAEAHAPIAQK